MSSQLPMSVSLCGSCSKRVRPNMTARTTRSNGFTLIEVLVVMMMFGIISTLTFQGFTAIVDANDRNLSFAQEHTQAQLAWSIILNDFISMVARPSRDILGAKQPAYRSNDDGYVVSFTRGGIAPYGVQSSLQQLAFSVEQGELIRWSWPTLDSGREIKPVAQVLMTDVSALTVEQLNLSGNFEQAWPPLNVNMASDSLPQMIKITILKQNGSALTRLVPGVARLDDAVNDDQARSNRFPLMDDSVVADAQSYPRGF